MKSLLNEDAGTIRFGDIYSKYKFFDVKNPLVIAFSHLGASVRESDICRSPSPWAYDYLTKNKINCLCFAGIVGKNNFYRDPEFISSLGNICTSIPDFPERLGYGTSMGAYAAAAFSEPLEVKRVLLGSPISTRNKKINYWDAESGRSLKSYSFEWDGLYNDAANTKALGYTIYDPLYGLDAMHAKRFHTLEKLILPGAGHSGFDLLNQIGIMNWVFKSFLNGKIDKISYYEKIRGRKEIPSYYFGLLGSDSTNINECRALVIKNHLSKDRPEVFKKIPKKFLEGPYIRKNHTPKKSKDRMSFLCFLNAQQKKLTSRLNSLVLRYPNLSFYINNFRRILYGGGNKSK